MARAPRARLLPVSVPAVVAVVTVTARVRVGGVKPPLAPWESALAALLALLASSFLMPLRALSLLAVLAVLAGGSRPGSPKGRYSKACWSEGPCRGRQTRHGVGRWVWADEAHGGVILAVAGAWNPRPT